MIHENPFIKNNNNNNVNNNYNNNTINNKKKEFKELKDDAVIYKLIGPVLVKQDKADATQNVDKRLEYINGEM